MNQNKSQPFLGKMVDGGVVLLSICAFVLFTCGVAQFFMKDKNVTTIFIFMLAGAAASTPSTNKKSHRESCMHFSNFRSVQSLNCLTPALTHFSYEAPGIATHNLSVKVKIAQHCSSSVRHLSTSIFFSLIGDNFFFMLGFKIKKCLTYTATA